MLEDREECIALESRAASQVKLVSSRVRRGREGDSVGSGLTQMSSHRTALGEEGGSTVYFEYSTHSVRCVNVAPASGGIIPLSDGCPDSMSWRLRRVGG